MDRGTVAIPMQSLTLLMNGTIWSSPCQLNLSLSSRHGLRIHLSIIHTILSEVGWICCLNSLLHYISKYKTFSSVSVKCWFFREIFSGIIIMLRECMFIFRCIHWDLVMEPEILNIPYIMLILQFICHFQKCNLFRKRRHLKWLLSWRRHKTFIFFEIENMLYIVHFIL